MQTNQESTGADASVNVLERRLELSLPLAGVEQEVEQRLRKMAHSVKMPGFRPGKVPFKLVAQQYGDEARSEAISAAAQKLFSEKVHEQQLRVVGYPRFEPRDGGGDQTQLAFSAVFEVYPDVKLGDISACEIERPTTEVGEAEIDKTIDVLRRQRATFHAAARGAVDSDRLVIDFSGSRNGEVFPGGEGKDFTLMIGAGRMLPEFEAALAGLAAGAEKSFDLTFPADYQAQDLAGQTVQFKVTVKSVEEQKLPAVDADFAKSLGVADGDLAKMRAEIAANLRREVGKRIQGRLKNQVMDALVKANPVTVPRILVQAEARQMAEAAVRDLQARGMSVKDVPVDPSWFTEQAERRAALGIIVAELVKDKGLAAKPEQVRGVIDELAETYEDPAEVVRWYYAQQERLAQADGLAVENNVVAWVLANAKVNDKSISFDELMGNAQ